MKNNMFAQSTISLSMNMNTTLQTSNLIWKTTLLTSNVSWYLSLVAVWSVGLVPCTPESEKKLKTRNRHFVSGCLQNFSKHISSLTTSSRFKLLQSSKWQTTTALLRIAKHLKYIATNIEKDFFWNFANASLCYANEIISDFRRRIQNEKLLKQKKEKVEQTKNQK